MMFADKTLDYTRFNLVRWFSISGMLAISFMSIFIATHFSRALTAHVLEHDAHVMTEFVNSIIRQGDNAFDSIEVEREVDTRRLASFFTQLNRVPGVIRANVYSPNATILWSSDEALLDQHFDDNDELMETLTGKPVSHFLSNDEDEKEEHILLPKGEVSFVEYYLPIWKSGLQRDEVVAVAEIYRVPFGLENKISSINYSVWISAIVGGAFLFISLFWVIRRADKIIQIQRERLLESQRLVIIGEMASTVAHSLRNPLANIRSSAELARENSNGEETNLALEQIMSEADMMETWVRQYLDQMRKDAETDERSVVQDVVLASIDELKNHPLNKNMRFVKEFEDDPVCVNFNTMILCQILSGIISNAIESRPADKTISIKVGRLQGSKNAFIEVNDSGTGVDKVNPEKVFEPFYTTKRNGLGIGLSLSKRIIERHGGSISVSPREGGGTTVTVLLLLE